MTGKLYFPLLAFAKFNLTQSSFFGATSPFYHLVQSLPILLFPLWYWWVQGFIACLLPFRWVPRSLVPLYRPRGMRSLARALTFAIFTLSFSPHSEWRFLHPFLPPLLLFALPPLFHSYTPTIIGAYRFTDALRQYTRIPKRVYYFLIIVPIVVCSYACIWHGWAEVEAMNVLRRGDVGEVTSLGVAAECHSTPWMSHLHRDIPTWMVTCEPPLGKG
jgi:phosphatidylinositol glycan class B